MQKLTREQALLEAERCLYCYDAPCQDKCPVNISIPEFIQSIKSGNLKGSRKAIQVTHPLIEICGQICPEFCKTECIRGKIDNPIEIRQLHKYVTDNTDPREDLFLPEIKKEKVAIVGSGPAGIACAVELRKEGYKPIIYEKSEFGGIPVQEISVERLDVKAQQNELGFIKNEFVGDIVKKDVKNIEKLVNEYKAVFIGIGLGEEIRLNIQGEDLEGVFYAREILRSIKNGKKSNAGKRVGVIGGGNVAIESACAIKREDPSRDVEVIYRRGLGELRAYDEEIQEAIDLGVVFQFASLPKKIYGNKKVEGIEIIRASLRETEKGTRRRPVPITNSKYHIPLDTIVIAIGQSPSKVFPEIEKTYKGFIRVDENMQTNIKGVFAGGDIVRGASSIVESVSDGLKAAKAIVNFLEGERDHV